MTGYLVVLVAVAATCCYGLPDGAPITACDSMTPGHGVAKQPTSPPFDITFDQAMVAPGSSVMVTIRGQPKFRGFLVKAMGSDGSLVGKFPPGGQNYQPLACSGQDQSAVTHTNRDDKSEVAITWIAPTNYDGEVTFEGTILANYTTFWHGVRAAQRLMVKRGATQSSSPGSIDTSATMPTGRALPAQASTIYEGCGQTKGCFGPDNCLNSKSCQYMVTYMVLANNTVSIELLGQFGGNQYVAVGFSSDAKMGDDSVVQCVSWNGQQSAWASTNGVGSNSGTTRSGVTLISSSNEGNTMYCNIQREPKAAQYDLINDQIYLLLSSGVPAGSDGTLTNHGVNKRVTENKIMLKDASSQKSAASRRGLIAAHVLLLASVSFLSRSYMF